MELGTRLRPPRTQSCPTGHELRIHWKIQNNHSFFGKTRGTGHSLDHVKSRLGLRDTSLRRHDARGEVDLLGRAVLSMCLTLGLDPAMNGVPRHQTLLPQA